MPNKTPISKNYKSALELYSLVKSILRNIYTAEFMAKEPNSNTDEKKAIAILVMGATKIIVNIKENIEKEEIEVAGTLLRSLLEVIANVNYIITSTKSNQLAQKYLKTEAETPKILHKILLKKELRLRAGLVLALIKGLNF